MKIALAADHGGVQLKSVLIEHLQKLNSIGDPNKSGKIYAITDLGGFDENALDYFAEDADKLVAKILGDEADLGILICGSGIGISMRANRYMGIRAALVHNKFTASSAKKHNNANVLCFGGRVVTSELACNCLDIFLAEKYEGGRHIERLKKLDAPLITL